MKKTYTKPYLGLKRLSLTSDIITMSGDGYADDPWSEGFGGEL